MPAEKSVILQSTEIDKALLSKAKKFAAQLIKKENEKLKRIREEKREIVVGKQERVEKKIESAFQAALDKKDQFSELKYRERLLNGVAQAIVTEVEKDSKSTGLTQHFDEISTHCHISEDDKKNPAFWYAVAKVAAEHGAVCSIMAAIFCIANRRLKKTDGTSLFLFDAIEESKVEAASLFNPSKRTRIAESLRKKGRPVPLYAGAVVTQLTREHLDNYIEMSEVYLRFLAADKLDVELADQLKTNLTDDLYAQLSLEQKVILLSQVAKDPNQKELTTKLRKDIVAECDIKKLSDSTSKVKYHLYLLSFAYANLSLDQQRNIKAEIKTYYASLAKKTPNPALRKESKFVNWVLLEVIPDKELSLEAFINSFKLFNFKDLMESYTSRRVIPFFEVGMDEESRIKALLGTAELPSNLDLEKLIFKNVNLKDKAIKADCIQLLAFCYTLIVTIEKAEKSEDLQNVLELFGKIEGKFKRHDQLKAGYFEWLQAINAAIGKKFERPGLGDVRSKTFNAIVKAKLNREVTRENERILKDKLSLLVVFHHLDLESKSRLSSLSTESGSGRGGILIDRTEGLSDEDIKQSFLQPFEVFRSKTEDKLKTLADPKEAEQVSKKLYDQTKAYLEKKKESGSSAIVPVDVVDAIKACSPFLIDLFNQSSSKSSELIALAGLLKEEASITIEDLDRALKANLFVDHFDLVFHCFKARTPFKSESVEANWQAIFKQLESLVKLKAFTNIKECRLRLQELKIALQDLLAACLSHPGKSLLNLEGLTKLTIKKMAAEFSRLGFPIKALDDMNNFFSGQLSQLEKLRVSINDIKQAEDKGSSKKYKPLLKSFNQLPDCMKTVLWKRLEKMFPGSLVKETRKSAIQRAGKGFLTKGLQKTGRILKFKAATWAYDEKTQQLALSKFQEPKAQVIINETPGLEKKIEIKQAEKKRH